MNKIFSKIWKYETNQQLLEFYKNVAAKLNVPDEIKSSLSSPYLILATPSYIENPEKRVIVFGKETKGWGWGGANLPTYLDFCEQKGKLGVEKLLMEYQLEFLLTERQKTKYKYWQMYKLMANQTYDNLIRASQLSANFIPVDYNGHSYLGNGRYLQYDKMPVKYVPELLLFAEKMLKGILSILKPKIAVFFTGATYDSNLSSFLGIDVSQAASLRELPECSAPNEEKIDLTETKTFIWNNICCIRTEHPRKIESRGAKCVKRIISETIRNLQESE